MKSHQHFRSTTANAVAHRHQPARDYSVKSLLVDRTHTADVNVINGHSPPHDYHVPLPMTDTRRLAADIDPLRPVSSELAGSSSSYATAAAAYYDALCSAFHRVHRSSSAGNVLPPASPSYPGRQAVTSLRRVPPHHQPDRVPTAYSRGGHRGVLPLPESLVGVQTVTHGRSPSPTVSPLSGGGRGQVRQRMAVDKHDGNSSRVTRLTDSNFGGYRRRTSAFDPAMGALQPATAADAEDEKDYGEVDPTRMSSAEATLTADESSSAGVSDDDDDAGVTIRLEHKELWDKFDELGTEMVITKSGRLEQ
jgi:hypothetical protein